MLRTKQGTKWILTLAAAVMGITLATPALGAMGTTECASADGSVRRVEKEVWGANQVEWSYQGKKLSEEQIHIAADPIMVEDETRLNPDLGVEVVASTVQKLVLDLGENQTVDTFVLCTSVSYPNAYD